VAWMPVLPEAAPSAPAASGAPLLMPLAHLALLQAGGADATAFLHGQLSNDVQGLAPGESLLAGYCNAKGRLFPAGGYGRWGAKAPAHVRVAKQGHADAA